jgi:mannose-6-phosphate isomerase-like protein (cupin superfamily)
MSPDFDPNAAGMEYVEKLPGLAECFEMDNPGMHTTDTVDYDIMLEGELTLEVDGGERRILRPGDIVVQHGTRHAWRNHTNKPATLVAILIGARRQHGTAGS